MISQLFLVRYVRMLQERGVSNSNVNQKLQVAYEFFENFVVAIESVRRKYCKLNKLINWNRFEERKIQMQNVREFWMLIKEKQNKDLLF